MDYKTFLKFNNLGKRLGSRLIQRYANHRYTFGSGRLESAWYAFLDVCEG